MFQGFTPETIDFLWGIRFNNSKEWLEPRKELYLSVLQRPMRELGKELFEPFSLIPGLKCTVSRIYRDNRIPQPVPYKDHLWITIKKQQAEYWGEVPTLFFELWPDSWGCGLVYWGPKAAVMEEFRNRISLQPAQFAAMAEKAERESGLALGGDTYKRIKPAPIPDVQRFFQLKNIIMCESNPIDDTLYSPQLADRLRRKLLPLLPVFEYLQSIAEATERPASVRPQWELPE